MNVICAQYSNKHPEEGKINLKYGSKVPSDDTLMRQLDEHGDRLIAFEAVKLADLPSRIGERVPLAPTNAQVSVQPKDTLREDPKALLPKPEAPQDENSKPGDGYQSPYIPPQRPPAAVAPAAASRLQVPAPQNPPGNIIVNQPVVHDPSPKPAPGAPPQAPHKSNTPDLPDWARSNGFLLHVEGSRPKFQARHPEVNDGKLA